MGSFEKLIVLTLVFLSIIVLVFSLGNQGPADPYGAPGRELERAGHELAERSGDGTSVPAESEAGRLDRGRLDRDGLELAEADPRLAGAGSLWSEAGSVEAGLAEVGLIEAFSDEQGSAAEGDNRNSEADRLFGGDSIVDRKPDASGAVAEGVTLLSAGEVAEQGLDLPDVNDFGQQRMLLLTQGLERTVDPDSLAYTTVGGETWLKLSRAFYGNARQAATLRNYNEGADLSVAGQTLFLPIYAPEVPVATPRTPRSADRVRPAPVASDGTGPETAPSTADAPGQDDVLTYVTQDGDTLSSIAQQFYDNGNKWALIFEANSGVLSNPNVLRVGVEIRLPGATRP